MRLLIILLALLTSTQSFAQSARDILDATAAHMTRSGCVKAKFKVTQFTGTTMRSEMSGTMLIQGRKFQMTTPDLLTWFDGKTQWSMFTESAEVNVSEPTDEEQAAMNPSTLIYLYKKGFNLSARPSTLRGRKTYEVHLTPQKKGAAYADIYVDVAQSDYTPLCIRVKQNGDWLRLSILTFETHQKASDSAFRFPAKEYPNAEIIDLR